MEANIAAAHAIATGTFWGTKAGMRGLKFHQGILAHLRPLGPVVGNVVHSHPDLILYRC